VQLTQETLERFRVRAVYIGSDDWSRTRQQMEAALRSSLGSGIVASIERVERIAPGPSGKVKAVISRLDS
jgi:hypothetical protein